MAAFHLRLPDVLYSRLRKRARDEGRSINAEVVSMLEEQLSRPSTSEFERRLAELHAAWRVSDDSPAPEELIREARDSR